MPREQEPMYKYYAFGLNLASELEIPELSDADVNGASDVSIHIEPVAIAHPTFFYLGMQICVTPGTFVMEIPDVGRFCVNEGCRISIEPNVGCDLDLLRVYLLGSIFGALFYQRNYLPLHANAIVSQGAAFAFAGRSGAGKSTLAAYFQKRGFDVLSDDVCAILFEKSGGCFCQAGLRRLKLRADSLSAIGHDAGKFPKIAENLDKFNVPMGGPMPRGAFALKRIYVLSGTASSASHRMERLEGADAMNAVLSNLYRRRFGELSNPTRMLEQAKLLVRNVEVFAAGRRWGLDRLESEGLRLERHVLAG